MTLPHDKMDFLQVQQESFTSQQTIVSNAVSSITEPILNLDYSLLSQSVKAEPSTNILYSVESEDVSSTVKSEILTPLASPVNPSSVKSEDTRCSPTTSPALTTELESFQDLTEWCHKASKTPNMSFPTETDELNTPVPEFGDLCWFASPTTIDHNEECNSLLNVLDQNGSPELYPVGTDIQSNKLNDLDSPIFGIDSTDNFNNIKSETYQYSNVLIGGGAVQESLKTKNVPCMNNYNNSVYTVNSGLSEQSSVSYPKSTTEMQSSSTEDISSVAQSSFIELTAESNISLPELISFPLESVVPKVGAERRTNLPRFDFSNIWPSEKQVISTPEVINTALSLANTSLDTTDFGQLVSFITNEKVVAEEVSPSSITNLEEEDSRLSAFPSTSNDPDPLYTPSESDDEEEEYEPPWKKRKTPSKSPRKIKSSLQRIDQDSETSNASTVESVRPVKRGRPPKRNVSISSESNADPEMSRYRELRDKNNEASRRSRLNRKKKEIEMEQEAQDLDVRNRKLKVRVQELERLVSTMRSNLMQMLMKK